MLASGSPSVVHQAFTDELCALEDDATHRLAGVHHLQQLMKSRDGNVSCTVLDQEPTQVAVEFLFVVCRKAWEKSVVHHPDGGFGG